MVVIDGISLHFEEKHDTRETNVIDMIAEISEITSKYGFSLDWYELLDKE